MDESGTSTANALPGETHDELYEHAPCGYLVTGLDRTIVRVNTTLLDWLKRDRAETIGRAFRDLLDADGRITWDSRGGPLLASESPLKQIMLDLQCSDGTKFPALLDWRAVSDDAATKVGYRIMAIHAADLQAHERELVAEREAARRKAEDLANKNAKLRSVIAERARTMAQYVLIAQFGHFALECSDVTEVLEEVCRVASKGLGVDFAQVFEWQSQDQEFVLRAGVGWGPGGVGVIRVGGGTASAAGYAFNTGGFVLSNDMASERRFAWPAAKREHELGSVLAVLIGRDRNVFGVLEASNRGVGTFEKQDVLFLQALSHRASAAIARDRAASEVRALNAAIAASEERLQVALEAAELGCWGLDLIDERSSFRSPRHDQIFGYNEMLPKWGLTIAEQHVHEEDRPAFRAAFADALKTGHLQCEVRVIHRNGEQHWIAPVGKTFYDDQRKPIRMIGVVADTTKRRQAEDDLRASKQALQRALADKDILTREIDHRVANSFSMFNSILGKQKRAAKSPAVKAALEEASTRLMTITRVHRQLYLNSDVSTVHMQNYIESVCNNVVTALGQADPVLVLDVDPISFSADDAISLGLITVELLTNALKYAGRDGRGPTIRISLKQKSDTIELTVEDDGPGLPADFAALSTRSLGMRLVESLRRQLRGTLQVGSRAVGAQFTVAIPSTAAIPAGTDRFPDPP